MKQNKMVKSETKVHPEYSSSSFFLLLKDGCSFFQSASCALSFRQLGRARKVGEFPRTKCKFFFYRTWLQAWKNLAFNLNAIQKERMRDRNIFEHIISKDSMSFTSNHRSPPAIPPGDRIHLPSSHHLREALVHRSVVISGYLAHWQSILHLTSKGSMYADSCSGSTVPFSEANLPQDRKARRRRYDGYTTVGTFFH